MTYFPSNEGTPEDRRAVAALSDGVLSIEAKKALAVYGSHLEWCNARMGWSNTACDCGLVALTGTLLDG